MNGPLCTAYVPFPFEASIKYGSYKVAKKALDGVAVLSTLFELSTTDNLQLTALLNHLDLVAKSGSNITIQNEISANIFLPVIMSPLYRYFGPSTYSCTVFYDTNTVSARQLSRLKSLNLLKNGDKPDKVNTRTAMVGAAWLDIGKITKQTGNDNGDFLQEAVKAEAGTAWYKKPTPVWTLILFTGITLLGMMVVVGLLQLKKILFTDHVELATEDIEMD